MGGDSSYDYGAAISEDRRLYREKYSEQKLQANFFKVSPAYLTAVAGNATNGTYVSTADINVAPVFGNTTNFYIVRHADFTSTNKTSYQLTVPTSQGFKTIPQLGGTLSLNGRDSKIHVTDYDVNGVSMLYSTAEIFSWASTGMQARYPGPPSPRPGPFSTWGHGTPQGTATSGSALILYGGAGEIHEFAVPASLPKPLLSPGSSATVRQLGSTWVVKWEVTNAAQIVLFGDFEVSLLWRNDAYNYWTLELPAASPIGNYSSMMKSLVIVKAGYLVRSAQVLGQTLSLTGDINRTTDVEIIAAPLSTISSIMFNGQRLDCGMSSHGRLMGTINFNQPSLELPQFSSEVWKSIDSLPESQPSYDDSLWTVANHSTTTNDQLGLQTPTSLFADDYGYHVGSLIFRGHFSAFGNETMLFVNASGGSGFGYSVWMNDLFLGSWVGSGLATQGQNFAVPSASLLPGQAAVITILIDHMGQDEEGPGTDAVKFPRGILAYSLTGHANTDIKWKLTGNLGGQQYRDLVRGPRNEGAMYVERQGYHQPNPPSMNWTTSSPINDGLTHAGVRFYATSFNLSVPEGYDVPMSFVFNDNIRTNNTNATFANYRCQLFVNGYQFGKYGKKPPFLDFHSWTNLFPTSLHDTDAYLCEPGNVNHSSATSYTHNTNTQTFD